MGFTVHSTPTQHRFRLVERRSICYKRESTALLMGCPLCGFQMSLPYCERAAGTFPRFRAKILTLGCTLQRRRHARAAEIDSCVSLF